MNQDSLDGAQASVSEVGSAEEFEKENTEDTPSGSHGEADGNKKKTEKERKRLIMESRETRCVGLLSCPGGEDEP